MSIISGASIVEFKNSLNEYEEKGIIVSKFRTYIKEFINKNKEKKQKKTRNPSDYNKFVKECMLNDDDIKKEGLTQGDPIKICSNKWEDYKNDNPELSEKKESNKYKDKDNQKKINVLPKKIKIKLDFPVDSDDNSDEKKVDEKKVDEKKKDEKKIKKEEEKKAKKEAKEAEKKAKKEAKEAEKKAKKEAKKNTKKEDKKEDSSDDEYDFDANVDTYLDDE